MFFWSTGGKVLAHTEALHGRPSGGSCWQLSWSAQKPWIRLFREPSIFVDEQNEILWKQNQSLQRPQSIDPGAHWQAWAVELFGMTAQNEQVVTVLEFWYLLATPALIWLITHSKCARCGNWLQRSRNKVFSYPRIINWSYIPKQNCLQDSNLPC